jgi:uncharacterized membrane protein YeaQ/YmgE (transglycosylase-associated protein family)
MWNLICWAFAGLIVGAIARLLMPGRQPLGLLMTMVVGIVGALVGGGIAWLVWGDPGEPFSSYAWPGYLLSILGAVLVLWAWLGTTRRAMG